MKSDGANSELKVFAAREDFARWQHPFRKGHILMRRDVLQTLSAEALEHLKTEEPSEIGGLLWGNATSDDSIAITDVTFMSLSGRLFNTTAADARNIEQAIKGRPPASNLSLLGYFRTHVRDGLQLTPQDRSLIEQHLQDPDAVFLIIRPFDFGICMAGFFFWKDGRLQTDSSDLEVPLIAPGILADEHQAADDNHIVDEAQAAPAPPRVDEKPAITATTEKRDSVKAEVTESEKEREKEKEDRYIVDFLRESIRSSPPEKGAKRPSANPGPQPALPPQKRPIWPTLLVSTAAILALMIAGAAVYVAVPIVRSRLQSEFQPPPASGIGLQVERASNGQLNLTWNRNSPQLIKATGATLIITDGQSVRRLQLDNQQLHSGRILYLAKNPDVQFQMELNSDSRDNSRILSESVHVMSPGGEKRARAGHRSKAVPNSASAGEAEAATTADVAQSTPEKQEQARIRSSLPERRPGTPPLVPVVTAATLPNSPSLSPSSAFVPPRAIEEMMPETTALGQFARISVKVRIDVTGRVISADPAQDGAPEDPSLAGIAVSAAKRWLFHPATLNGVPVPSDYTIVFAFHPQLGNTAQ